MVDKIYPIVCEKCSGIGSIGVSRHLFHRFFSRSVMRPNAGVLPVIQPNDSIENKSTEALEALFLASARAPDGQHESREDISRDRKI